MKNILKLNSLFNSKDLLDLALTHKSWVNENPGKRGSNERLEFLGDAILEFVVSGQLYEKFPDKEEGYLTALRANIVNTVNLAKTAKNIDLGKALYLSKGEEEGGGRENSSLLADTVEAVIGALYLDQGLPASENFIKENLLFDIEIKTKEPLKDPKSRLQEYVQAKGLPTPKYRVFKESGPDHEKNFQVEVVIDNKSWGLGEGKSKSLAEQKAAENALFKVL